MDELLMLLQAKLDEAKSKGNINSDIKKIQGQIDKLKVQAEIDPKAISNLVKQLEGIINQKINITNINVDVGNAQKVGQQVGQTIANATQKEIDKVTQKANKIQLSTDLTKLETDYKKFGVVSQEVENDIKEAKKAYDSFVNAKGTDRLEAEMNSYTSALEKAKSSWKELSATQVSLSQRTSQMTHMQDWMRKNKAATKLVGDEVNKLIEECKTCDAVRFNGIKNEFKELQVQAGKAGKLGSGTLEGLIEQGKKFAQWVGVSGFTMQIAYAFKNAISNIKEVDTLLTEISKTSEATTAQLKELGKESYSIASKYGISNTSYLTGVQEMNRSGYQGELGNQMAELSVKAQAAGDMNEEIADSYLLATNAAYKYEGSVEKLNAVLDGQNIITNRNSVDMEAMASATEKAGSTASMTGVKIEELSALIGTIESATKEGGEQVGTGIKSLLINLQNVNSDKIVRTLDKANASMTKTVNGVEKMRTPIEILKDLAETFNSLDASDPLKSEILTNIGQKFHANELSALLSNWDSYEKMLQEYSQGTGSAAEEAEKSAKSLEGRLNSLDNTWKKLVSDLVNSDELKAGVTGLTDLLSVIEKIGSALGGFGTISTVASGILGANGLGLTNYVTI